MVPDVREGEAVTLTEFLTARLDEDEAAARRDLSLAHPDYREEWRP